MAYESETIGKIERCAEIETEKNCIFLLHRLN